MIALHRSVHRPATRASLARALATVERWLERRRQRRALLALDDKLLKDIGLSPADAWQESQKPFWRI
jgi:uncharacterized protein YjiS (DUF1127 family)